MRQLPTLALLAVLATPAHAFTEADAIAPQTAQIALCTEGLAEVARQAAGYHDELAARLDWRRGLLAELDRGALRLSEDHDRQRAIAAQAVAAAPGLVPLGMDQAAVPRIGWGIFGFFEQHRDQTNQAIADAESGVAAGQAGFSVAGLGVVTRQGLTEAIAADQRQIDDHLAAVGAGTFAIGFPGIGWASRDSLTACIAEARSQIAATQALIAAGDYPVVLPHLGTQTRNSLLALITAARTELSQLETAAADGALTIGRPGRGGFNGQTLQAWIAANETAVAQTRANIAQGAFTYPFPGMIHTSAPMLDQLVADTEAGIAQVEALVAAGSYTVPTAFGIAHDANAARAALALPDCRPDGPSPCTPPEHRPYHEDVLRRVPLAAAADIAMREADLELYRGWRAALDSHALPVLRQLETERAALDALGDEFAIELSPHRRRIQRHVDWLQGNLDMIP